jgi:hypothetical protein
MTDTDTTIITMAVALAAQKECADRYWAELEELRSNSETRIDQNARLALTVQEQAAEITRLNEECARRALDLVTFDEMRKEAIAQRDEVNADFKYLNEDFKRASDILKALCAQCGIDGLRENWPQILDLMTIKQRSTMNELNAAYARIKELDACLSSLTLLTLNTSDNHFTQS